MAKSFTDLDFQRTPTGSSLANNLSHLKEIFALSAKETIEARTEHLRYVEASGDNISLEDYIRTFWKRG